jgi:hypothetical protein
MAASGIRAIGRNTQGVRLIDTASGDRLVAVSRLAEKQGEGAVSAPGDDITPPVSE